ncbi:thymidylate synthase [Yersinia enterocolitica]
MKRAFILPIRNKVFTYDVGNGVFPLITIRKGFYKAAIAELLGYLRGYSNAKDFAALGTKTWLANANENEAWLNNTARRGPGDMGRVYGVQAREWIRPDGTKLDQLKKVYDNLKAGIDDRGEIITFYNPGEVHLGCLRPCMHTHQFSLLGDTLHMTSIQRSCDMPLGYVFNAVQCYVLLALMARITGHKAGQVTHVISNAHIYENQVEAMESILDNVQLPSPRLAISDDITVLDDLLTWATTDEFHVENYAHHGHIAIPFTE